MMGQLPEAEDVPALAALLATLPERLNGIIARRVAIDADGIALREAGRACSYRQLAAAQEALAPKLTSLGVRGGDRVMIIGENSIALVAILFALSAIDAWAVMVNARLSAPEIDSIREHCGARRVIYLTHVSPEAAIHADLHGASPFDLGNLGAVRISALNESCLAEPVFASGSDQVAALIYTSGTTGNPKGVMLTHRNLLFIAAMSSVLRKISPADCVYGVLPISHVYGLASVCLGSLNGGAAVYLEPRYTPQHMADALRIQGITVCQGVPAMYAKLLEWLRVNGETIGAPALRFIYAGGSPLDPALKRDVESMFGLTLNNGYGLTEASPTVAQTRLDEPRTDCSVGRALPHVDICLRDAKGGDVATGEPGELWVRGPAIMKGYYRNAEATAAVIDGHGWLNTGDVARMDPDQALFIVGRTKELIIRSGFNVYPVEVEAVLSSHPEVTQAAVVGRAVDGNEEVVAFIERIPGALVDEATLMDFAAQSLAPYKRPAQIIFMSPLPAAANGKVLKGKLKDLLQHRDANQ